MQRGKSEAVYIDERDRAKMGLSRSEANQVKSYRWKAFGSLVSGSSDSRTAGAHPEAIAVTMTAGAALVVWKHIRDLNEAVRCQRELVPSLTSGGIDDATKEEYISHGVFATKCYFAFRESVARFIRYRCLLQSRVYGWHMHSNELMLSGKEATRTAFVAPTDVSVGGNVIQPAYQQPVVRGQRLRIGVLPSWAPRQSSRGGRDRLSRGAWTGTGPCPWGMGPEFEAAMCKFVQNTVHTGSRVQILRAAANHFLGNEAVQPCEYISIAELLQSLNASIPPGSGIAAFEETEAMGIFKKVQRDYQEPWVVTKDGNLLREAECES